ncbi:hypothetical protein EMN47_16935 [Prolixibacteraceae bacterium JC049]|nr:hypothetical protein [Prolixibacteraceae bacterium JC049]
MEKRWLEKINNSIKKIDPKKNQKPLIYLICVLIASTLWFLNALSDSYTTTISFPVKFTNFPENKILVNEPPKKLDLKVNAFGFTLLRNSLSMAFHPLIFNVNEFTNQRMQRSQSSYFRIGTDRYLERLQSQVSSEMKIISVMPDSIIFQFDPIVEKKVGIKANVQLSTKEQFIQTSSIKLIPDSVQLAGPKSVLDTLNYITTDLMEFTGVNKTIHRNISLPDINNITYKKKRTVLNIPIEQYTESKISVPVQVINAPDSIKLITFPSKIEINYLVALSQYKNIDHSLFKAIVDYSETNKVKNKISINIQQAPQNIISYSFDIKSVEYLKEKISND